MYVQECSEMNINRILYEQKKIIDVLTGGIFYIHTLFFAILILTLYHIKMKHSSVSNASQS